MDIEMAVITARPYFVSAAPKLFNEPFAIFWVTGNAAGASRVPIAQEVPQDIRIDRQRFCRVLERSRSGDRMVVLTALDESMSDIRGSSYSTRFNVRLGPLLLDGGLRAAHPGTD